MIHEFEIEDTDYFSNKTCFLFVFFSHLTTFEIRPFDQQHGFWISSEKYMRINTKSKFWRSCSRCSCFVNSLLLVLRCHKLLGMKMVFNGMFIFQKLRVLDKKFLKTANGEWKHFVACLKRLFVRSTWYIFALSVKINKCFSDTDLKVCRRHQHNDVSKVCFEKDY